MTRTCFRWVALVAVVLLVVVPSGVMAQDVPEEAAAGDLVLVDPAAAVEPNDGSGSFISIVRGSGPLGIMLWFALFAAAGVAVYFVVDCAITVRAQRIIPRKLIEQVAAAMAEGDVIQALQHCRNEPGPMANILSAGFSHVEEGFEVIQEAVATSADIEAENIMQKLTWLSVVGNIAPMLGLLGTVQGMIMAFSNLSAGAPDVGVLAMNISQALFTTAGGLTIAVPCVTFYYSFRNTANKIILKMEAITMEMIKDLRNVELVDE